MFSNLEPVETSFTAAAPAAIVRTEIVRILTAKGGRIKSDDNSSVVASFGSNLKIRLLGPFLAGFKSVPRDVVVGLKESGGQTEVSITVRDTFGFGVRLGVATQMRDIFRNDASSLQNTLEDALIQHAPAPPSAV